MSRVARWLTHARHSARHPRRRAASEPRVRLEDIVRSSPSVSRKPPIFSHSRKRAQSCAQLPLESARKRPRTTLRSHHPSQLRNTPSSQGWDARQQGNTPSLAHQPWGSTPSPHRGTSPAPKTPLERHELGVAKGLLERSAASSRIMWTHDSSIPSLELTTNGSLVPASRPSTPATYGIGRPTFSLSSTDDGSTASSSHGCPGVEIGTGACALDLIVGSLKSASLDPAAAGASRPHQHACVASNSQHGSDGQSARSNDNRSSQVRAVTPFRIVTEVVIASSGSDSVQSEVMDLQAEIKSARDAFDLFEQTLDIDVCAQVISTLRSVRTRLVEQRYRDKKARETREQLEAMTPEAREAAVNELREKKRLAQQAWRAKRARTRSASSASSRSTTDAPPESSSSGSQSVQTARAHPARMVNRQSKMVPCGRGKTLVVPVSSNSGAASTSTNTSETTVSTPSVNDGESQTLVEISAPAPSSPAAPSYGQNSEFVSDSDVDWAALSEARIPLSPVVTTAVLQPLAPVVHRLPPSLTSDDASERTTLGVVGMEQTPMWSQRVLNESSSSGTSAERIISASNPALRGLSDVSIDMNDPWNRSLTNFLAATVPIVENELGIGAEDPEHPSLSNDERGVTLSPPHCTCVRQMAARNVGRISQITNYTLSPTELDTSQQHFWVWLQKKPSGARSSITRALDKQDDAAQPRTRTWLSEATYGKPTVEYALASAPIVFTRLLGVSAKPLSLVAGSYSDDCIVPNQEPTHRVA
ncbi:hypothetical protein QAD02_006885 [Eretmocerus hayati]|uniref:Uncharacterized protein n=3 Tax=Eretmocerus hayati TaxID=131215 RepID=A0ACC2N3D3_9HYME|nr:hypothetical protein QAD02_006885 [Eretmocerus hayati]